MRELFADGSGGNPLSQPDQRLMPVGLEIAPRVQEQESSDHYAWGRLARLLTQDLINETISSTPMDITYVHLDACSAIPWYREVMRGQFAKNVPFRAARLAVNGFEHRFEVRDEAVIPGFKKMRQEKMSEVRAALFTRNDPKKPQRRIITQVAFDAFFNPVEGLDTTSVEALSQDFLRRFQQSPSQELIEVIENSPDGEIKGSWISLVTNEWPFSVADIVHSTPLTEEEAESLLKSMADHFARESAGKIRRTKFLSLDLEGVEYFRRVADGNFPLDHLDTAFFKKVLDPERHIEGDIRDLRGFEDGIVSSYTMIEGFPFYKDNFNNSDGVQILSEIRRVLRNEGRFIAFPWLAHVAGQNDTEALSQFEEYLHSNGFSVEVIEKEKAELLDGMKPRELALVGRSPIFTETGEFLPLLVATKNAKASTFPPASPRE